MLKKNQVLGQGRTNLTSLSSKHTNHRQYLSFFGSKQKNTSQSVEVTSIESPVSKTVVPKKAGGSQRWKDWKKDDDKERRRIRELERRKKKGSTNTYMSKRKAVKAVVTAECDRTGTDISIEENRAAIAFRNLNVLERPILRAQIILKSCT